MRSHPLLFYRLSVSTEGPETRQHRHFARHRPHGEVAHPGLRIPGEAAFTFAVTLFSTRAFLALRMLKFMHFLTFIIHDLMQSLGEVVSLPTVAVHELLTSPL